jgi:UDP-2,3-diacylglucosamine pyrophosphatase LpxH
MNHYFLSDLHRGDGGPRDNSVVGNREAELNSFLDHVEADHGKLYVLGDLLDFWQSNFDRVLLRNLPLLDRLWAMRAVYVLGNHDWELYDLTGTSLIGHPLINNAVPIITMRVNGRRIVGTHGHEADSQCECNSPGAGRIAAIAMGMLEDINGGPLLDKYGLIESTASDCLEVLTNLWRGSKGAPEEDYYTRINHTLTGVYPSADALIFGHTHQAGSVGRLYNCGAWAESVCSCTVVGDDGVPRVFDWVDGKLVPNNTVLPW